MARAWWTGLTGSAAMYLATSLAAFACMPYVAAVPASATADDMDPALKLGADCSFEDRAFRVVSRSPRGRALEVTPDYLGGLAVKDRGNGLVAQRIVGPMTCFKTEWLLAVDCRSGNAALISGVAAPTDGHFGDRLIAHIQPPHGPISVTRETTIPGLIQTAQANGLDVTADVAGFFAKRGKDQYDHSCGCKLYYPGSPGAGG